jgi:hypothetical protein
MVKQRYRYRVSSLSTTLRWCPRSGGRRQWPTASRYRRIWASCSSSMSSRATRSRECCTEGIRCSLISGSYSSLLHDRRCSWSLWRAGHEVGQAGGASPPISAHGKEQLTTSTGNGSCLVYWESAELAVSSSRHSFLPARTVRLPAWADGQRSRPWRLSLFQRHQSIAPFPPPSDAALATGSTRLGVLARHARVSTPPSYLSQAGDTDSHSPYRRIHASVWSFLALRGTRSLHSGSQRGPRLLERGAPRAGPYHNLRADDSEIDAARVCGTLPPQAGRSHPLIRGKHGGHAHGPSDGVTGAPPNVRASPVARVFPLLVVSKPLRL